MPRFIATHSVPFTRDVLVKYAKEEAPKFAKSGVTWIRTFCDFPNNKHFCEWLGPNKEAIEKILKDLSIPYDGLHEVKIFDVKEVKFED
jgi:hypothetical protein